MCVSAALDQADEGPHPSSRSSDSVALIGSWHLTDRPLETRGKKPLGPGFPRACLVSSVSLRALGYSSPTAGARTWLSASGNSRAMGRCAPGSRLRRQCCAKRMHRFSFVRRSVGRRGHACDATSYSCDLPGFLRLHTYCRVALHALLLRGRHGKPSFLKINK